MEHSIKLIFLKRYIPSIYFSPNQIIILGFFLIGLILFCLFILITFQKMTSLDAHMWLEDAEGNVVNDCDFPQYDYVKAVRNLKGEKKYKAWEGEKGKKAMATVQKMVQVRMDATCSATGFTKKQYWEFYRNKPVSGCCFMNAMAYWKKNKHLKIRVGSMGWEKKDGSGVWWEFG